MGEDPKESQLRAREACARLVYELGVESNKENPYFLPYTNYVMSWPYHLPINTLIIGQNPYYQNVYPELGAAFAYDERKANYTQSVKVLARDIYNYDSTDIRSSTECFRDSWKLLDIGVVLINETVYDKISSDHKNSRAIKEMEAQCRALQVLITESYLLGQTTVTCIGMGTKAKCMTSIIRSWYPKDLLKMRVMTCMNPAARDIGDMPSHQVTIGKTAVSKVLSNIVKSYLEMPPYKDSAQEKRRKQNADALKKGAENVSVSADQYSNELKSFEDRLRSSLEGGSSSSTTEEIMNSSGALRRAIDKHKNSIMSYNITLLMIVEAIDRTPTPQGSDKGKSPAPSVATFNPGKPSGGRRRVSRSVTNTSVVEPVPEAVEPEESLSIQPATPSPAPSRARRGVRRVSNYTPSNADTEYTTTSQYPSSSANKPKDMSPAESIIIKIFANWCNDNNADPVCSEILHQAAEENSVFSPLVKNVVLYIRRRKNQDPEYDAFDELTDPESRSALWAKENIVLEA